MVLLRSLLKENHFALPVVLRVVEIIACHAHLILRGLLMSKSHPHEKELMSPLVQRFWGFCDILDSTKVTIVNARFMFNGSFTHCVKDK